MFCNRQNSLFNEAFYAPGGKGVYLCNVTDDAGQVIAGRSTPNDRQQITLSAGLLPLLQQ
jgi:hypothetical protein